jgi:hypothetical protein
MVTNVRKPESILRRPPRLQLRSLGVRFLNSLQAMNQTAGDTIRVKIPRGMSDGNLGRAICIIEFPSMKMPRTRYREALFVGETAWAEANFLRIKFSSAFKMTSVATDENRIILTGVSRKIQDQREKYPRTVNQRKDKSRFPSNQAIRRRVHNSTRIPAASPSSAAIYGQFHTCRRIKERA